MLPPDMQSAMLPCTMCREQKRAAEGNDGGIKYWWILPFLSFFFSLNNQSFWIDECCTALCAMQQGMEGCWKKICEIAVAMLLLLPFIFVASSDGCGV